MNQSEIYSLAKAVGLTSAKAKVAAAIAMAESGGDPGSHTVDSDDDSWGLWQINMKGDLGPERRRQFSLSADSDLADPLVNAKAMYAISGHGSSWKKWGAYTNGSYMRFLNNPVTEVAGILDRLIRAVPGGETAIGIGQNIDSWDDTAATVVDALQRTTTWITKPSNWARVAYVVGGGALVLVSLQLIARPYLAQAVSAAAKVLPVGKVATAAKAAVSK